MFSATQTQFATKQPPAKTISGTLKKTLILITAILVLCTVLAQQLANESFSEVVSLVQFSTMQSPRDAAPDGDGKLVYFVATGTNGPGLFSVSMAGGDALEVKVSAPFVEPYGLALSSDGSQIFIADRKAGNGGQIFVWQLADTTLRPLANTEGTAPRGLEVVSVNGQDELFFTGQDAGQPAVFKLSLSNEARSTLAQGAPLEDPSGVTATQAGIVFVSDRGGSESEGIVWKLEGATLTTLAEGVRMGDPAGIALTPDETVLAVSSHSDLGTSQVLLINVGTLETSIFNKVIGDNSASGGLHRAHGGNSDVFAWVDNDGQIFRVVPKR
jgi:DNA-binding beta-propeller fold protein YncE